MKKATLQTVARDVRAIARGFALLQKPANQPALKAAPLAKGEIEVGLTLHENRPARLILLVNALDAIKPSSWQDVQDWAKNFNASAPSRIDALVLLHFAPNRFKTDRAYWTCEQHAGVPSCAWGQYFGNGYQLLWGKDILLRACAVRREFIR